jgi:hypothetical protein
MYDVCFLHPLTRPSNHNLVGVAAAACEDSQWPNAATQQIFQGFPPGPAVTSAAGAAAATAAAFSASMLGGNTQRAMEDDTCSVELAYDAPSPAWPVIQDSDEEARDEQDTQGKPTAVSVSFCCISSPCLCNRGLTRIG